MSDTIKHLKRMWLKAELKAYDLQEAAEFEARVAAKLADPQFRHCSSSNSCYVEKRPFMMDCKDCRLHDAYLAVEGEMDG